MATITPVLGSQILVQIGTPSGNSVVYAHTNVVNTTRGVTLSTDVETDDLVDLADQSAPAQKFRRVKSRDVKIDGAGMMDADSTLEWIERWEAGAEFQARVTDGNWSITGPFVLTQFQLSADRTKPGENQITLEQSGPVTVAEV